MGIRQTAQPLGVGAAAITIPTLALRYGVGPALAVPAAFAVVAGFLCWAAVIDPPRPSRAIANPAITQNPYRHSTLLLRIHAVSVLLVIPQFVAWTFMLVWLINDQGWAPGAAGMLVTVSQVLGAAGRLAVGAWSDRVKSRMRPLRTIAAASSVAMALLAVTDLRHDPLAIVFMVCAMVISVADNGIAFTAVAEIAGPFWSGRALGAQNTSQSLVASFVPPVVGGLIAVIGFPGSFAVTAAFPALAIGLVPVASRDRPTDGVSATGSADLGSREPVAGDDSKHIQDRLRGPQAALSVLPRRSTGTPDGHGQLSRTGMVSESNRSRPPDRSASRPARALRRLL